ncbi:MAG: ABC transporter permease subunit [Spirochaetaceae bacterium]|nr:MAG: ABC transporter permease subunit [Spirochaetaceae bacterium]
MSRTPDGRNARAVCREFLHYLPLLPFVLFIVAGVVYTAVQSFGYRVSVLPGEVYRAGYAEILASAWFYRSVAYSLFVATISTALSACLGTVLALVLRGLPHKLYPFALVYKVPLILPHVVVGLVVLVGFRHPIVSGRLPAAPGSVALITAYVVKSAPFVTLLVYAVLRSFDVRQLETARMLGAGPLRAFVRLVLPVIRTPAATASVIVFLYSFGAFDLPFLLGASRPAMLAIDVHNRYWYRDLSARPAAMAALVVMFVFSVVFVIVYFRLVRRQKHGVRHV